MKKVMFILTIVQNTLIGRSKKKIGNAVFTTWKGKNVLKSKPVTVENPKTPNQLMRRDAFKSTVSIFRLAANVIRDGFKSQAIGMSEFNAFSSYALTHAFDYSTPPTASLIPANLLFSKGTIYPAAISSASASAGTGNLTVNFASTATQPGQATSDKVLLAAYNETQDKLDSISSSVARSAGTIVYSLPTAPVLGDTVDVFLGFKRADGSEASDSVYLQITVGA